MPTTAVYLTFTWKDSIDWVGCLISPILTKLDNVFLPESAVQLPVSDYLQDTQDSSSPDLTSGEPLKKYPFN
ncbi:unnamed protein product [Allacma fusca]|uniref:Uncharacterized protein n=1 Tax=Allacma fusca TaxID=39272 RepID=A0A8J2LQU0_9HEXA|nr:unnamed protein product [Allacma fusca]